MLPGAEIQPLTEIGGGVGWVVEGSPTETDNVELGSAMKLP